MEHLDRKSEDTRTVSSFEVVVTWNPSASTTIQLCERVRRAEQELNLYRIALGAQVQSI